MAGTPKNPAVERVAGIPFDKDSVSPLPQITPRARDAAPGEHTEAAEVPSADAGPPHGHEEYPGPQTGSSGTRAEPGRPRPATSGDR